MRRNNPTRVVETGRVVRGSSGQGVGWLQSLADQFRNLRARAQSVNDRINTPLREGVPGCVNGERKFSANAGVIVTTTNYPTSDPVNPQAGSSGTSIATLLLNPIILAGQTYKIPITFTPPGVFEAHNLVVNIEVGLTKFANTNIPNLTPIADYRSYLITSGNISAGFVAENASASVIAWTNQRQVLGIFQQEIPFLPYLWNIVDEKSGRQYAQNWMPSGALLNSRGFINPVGGRTVHTDSDFFEFDTPWLFERDAQVSFLFRPIMDLYQVDKSDATLPYIVDDKSGGARSEQANVVVEFHGNRYYEKQDVLKEGAYVTGNGGRILDR